MNHSWFRVFLVRTALVAAIGVQSGLAQANPDSGENLIKSNHPAVALGSTLVDLDLEPPAGLVYVGDVFTVHLIARTDTQLTQSISSLGIALQWDATFIELQGNTNDGPYTWLLSGFPNDSALDDLNGTFLDGDAFYQALSSPANPAVGTPQGLHVTTLVFEAKQPTVGASLAIEPTIGAFTSSQVAGADFVGQDVTGRLGTISLRVCSGGPGDDDADGVENCFDACSNTPPNEQASSEGCSCSQITCDDGAFCNGTESCLNGVCEPGIAPCDDGIACTDDTCNEATDSCINTPNDSACQNGLFCDGFEICDPGAGCMDGPDPDCDDQIACTVDRCDEIDDACVHAPDDLACADGNICTSDICDPAVGCLNDGTDVSLPCDDGNACTTGDVCQGDNAGSCQGVDTSDVDCDDGIGCTTDSCDPATGCAHVPIDAMCDDTNVCTTDTCDTSLGCVNDGTAIVVPCDDGNACTTTDQCQGDAPGTCQGMDTSAIDCDDGLDCTDDSCDPVTGCVHTPRNATCDDHNPCTQDVCDIVVGCTNDGSGIIDPCDDGNACTTNDVCQGNQSGTCLGTDTSAVDCDDGVGCTTDTCDPATGCAHTPEDSVCDDGNVCTLDTCDANTGCVFDGTGVSLSCDDGNACTTGDACQGDPAGTCQGIDTSDTDCNDGIDCTVDTCDPATGCAHVPDAGSCDDGNICTLDGCDANVGCTHDGSGIILNCDDGNACTTGDVCLGDPLGTCQGADTSLVDCDDGVDCTVDGCDPGSGCTHVGDDDSCDDGNICTLDLCDLSLGCMSDGTGITNPCDDGNACTTGDVCQGDFVGTCSGMDTSETDCNDGIGCTVDTCDPRSGCAHTPDDALCDDGLYCNGREFCDIALDCQPGSAPCDDADFPFCDEDSNKCVQCLSSGDSDGDGHVDRQDFWQFFSCQTGPAGPSDTPAVPPSCRCLDDNDDGDVDLEDLSEFQRNFTN